MSWLFKGEEVALGQGKYSTQVTKSAKNDDNIEEHLLLISNLQEGDIGPYVCLVHSGFNENEDKHEIWVKCKSSDRKFNYLALAPALAVTVKKIFLHRCEH